MGPRLIRVYHYTSTDHLPDILNDGFLKTVESTSASSGITPGRTSCGCPPTQSRKTALSA